jgi:hypothetical protein
MSEPETPPFIVVGVSAGTGSPTALRWAAEEAARRGCELVAVRAWRAPRPPSAPGGKPPAVSSDSHTVFAEAGQRLLADVAAALGEGHEVRCKLIKGPPVAVLLKESADAEMLVLDAPRRSEIKARTLLAQRLVYQVQCPVAVMPPAMTQPAPGKLANAGKQLGSKLAQAAGTAGRPGIRLTPTRN